MNILILKDNRIKKGVDGTATYFKNYVLELKSRNLHIVALIEQTDTYLIEFCKIHEIKYVTMPNHRLISRKPLKTALNIIQIRNLVRHLVKEEKIDIIDLHHHSLFHLVPNSIRSKLVVHQHGALNEEQIIKSQSYKLFSRSHLHYIKRKFMYRLDIADLIIVAGFDAKNSTIKQFKCSNANFIVSPYGTVGEHEFCEFKKCADLPKILICGRFTEAKGAIDCLKFSELLRKRLPGMLTIEHAGHLDASDVRVNEASQTLKHDIKFLGHVENITTKMKNYWALLNLSHREAGGMILFEAKAASLPVFAWNSVGIREFVNHGSDGFLYDQGDFDGIIEGIKLVLSDSDLYEKLRLNSFYDFNQNYQFKRHVDRLLIKYKEIKS